MNANSERYRWSDPQLHFAETKSLALIIGFSVNKIFALEKSSAEIGHCVMHQKMRKGACTAVHFSPEAILSIMVKLKVAKKFICKCETWHFELPLAVFTYLLFVKGKRYELLESMKITKQNHHFKFWLNRKNHLCLCCHSTGPQHFKHTIKANCSLCLEFFLSLHLLSNNST